MKITKFNPDKAELLHHDSWYSFVDGEGVDGIEQESLYAQGDKFFSIFVTINIDSLNLTGNSLQKIAFDIVERSLRGADSLMQYAPKKKRKKFKKKFLKKKEG